MCPQQRPHICQLLHVPISDMSVRMYTSYWLNEINNVTSSTGIHIHIIDLCSWTNMPTTLHACPTANEYAPKVPYTCQMTRLLDVHQWGEYANTYATYELTGINHVTRNTVQRWHWRCQQCRTMMPQPNYIYWVGHLAHSVKNPICEWLWCYLLEVIIIVLGSWILV